MPEWEQQGPVRDLQAVLQGDVQHLSAVCEGPDGGRRCDAGGFSCGVPKHRLVPRRGEFRRVAEAHCGEPVA